MNCPINGMSLLQKILDKTHQHSQAIAMQRTSTPRNSTISSTDAEDLNLAYIGQITPKNGGKGKRLTKRKLQFDEVSPMTQQLLSKRMRRGAANAIQEEEDSAEIPPNQLAAR